MAISWRINQNSHCSCSLPTSNAGLRNVYGSLSKILRCVALTGSPGIAEGVRSQGVEKSVLGTRKCGCSVTNHREDSEQLRSGWKHPSPGAVSPLRTFQNLLMVWIWAGTLHFIVGLRTSMNGHFWCLCRQFHHVPMNKSEQPKQSNILATVSLPSKTLPSTSSP